MESRGGSFLASAEDADGTLWIAKFPSREDRYDVGAWELVVHRLAKKAGIVVPEARAESLTDRYSTFCVARFDRRAQSRRMFASAMTLLERQDGERNQSYLDLAEFIADHGAAGHVEEDLEQLFTRVLFNVLVSNRDDHLRNHGFIRERSGWRLAPAYDMNPNLAKAEHALTLDGALARPDVAVVLATADLYRVTPDGAAPALARVRDAVATWRDEAKDLGLSGAEVTRMKAAFEN